jgi:hypothetical protein
MDIGHGAPKDKEPPGFPPLVVAPAAPVYAFCVPSCVYTVWVRYRAKSCV